MGPLQGIKVVEFASIGPGPFAAMMLSDMGADVLRLERHAPTTRGDEAEPSKDLLHRGRLSVGVDLKNPDGVAVALRLLERADIAIEGFRPGVMEKLGLGPDVCLARNPRLIYGRMTGWGQTGPLAKCAGHDINYIALSGVLEQIGRAGERPVPPLNLVGDFGGGAMLLAFGVLAALVERQNSGLGQVVDAAMVDGSALLCTMFYAFRHMGAWREERGTNLLDTGAPFYEVYETQDQKYVAVGALEAPFYAELVRRAGLDRAPDLPAQMDTARWPEMKLRWAALFKTKTRAEWTRLLEGTDACFAPVLSPLEAPEHPHNQARGTFVTVAGALQPAPAPRFSRTPGMIQRPPAMPGAHTEEALKAWGFRDDELERLRAARAIG